MRILKKSMAILITLAMVLSLVSFNVMAATEDYTVTYVVKNAADATTGIEGTKASKDVYVDVMISKHNYVSLNIVLEASCDVTAADVTNIATGYVVNGLVDESADKITLAWWTGVDLTASEDGKIATIKLTVPADASGDAYKLLEMTDYSVTANAESVMGVMTNATIKILPSFPADTAVIEDAEYEVALGTSVEDVIAELPTTATVTGAGNEEAGWAVTGWACDSYDADAVGEYTFTAKVMPDESKAGVVAEAGLDVTATVEVVPFATGTVTGAPEKVEYVVTEEDVTYDAAAAKAGILEALEAEEIVLTIASGDYTDTIAITDDMITATDVDTTAEAVTEDAITITIPAETESANGLFVLDEEIVIGIDLEIVPAVITGGSVKLPNANQNGKPKVTITFPTETTGEGEEAVTTVVDIEAGQEITADIVDGDGEVAGTVAVTVTEEDIEAGGLTLQFADTLKEMGFTSGDEYTVIVKVDGAEFLNGDALEGEGTTNDVKYSGGSSVSGINNTATTTKEYAVKVADAVNGTVAVSKTAAVNGTVITITATPAEGYKVDAVAVTDKNGINIPVDATAMTFTMPAKEVTVKVTFVEGEAEVVVTPPATEGLTDVDGHWAADAINALVEAGIVNGNADGTFAPDNAITRAEFTKMIVNLFGVKATSTETGFVDCAADAWFTPYVAAAKEAGYVTGVSETEFAPDALVTREQACAILGRALNASTDAAVTFTDAAEIEEYAIGYVAALAELGLVNGYEDGSFAPAKNITRAEAAKIIAGALELVSKIEEAATEEAATEEAVVEEATEEVVAEEEATEEAAEEVVEEVVEDEVPEEVVDEK